MPQFPHLQEAIINLPSQVGSVTVNASCQWKTRNVLWAPPERCFLPRGERSHVLHTPAYQAWASCSCWWSFLFLTHPDMLFFFLLTPNNICQMRPKYIDHIILFPKLSLLARVWVCQWFAYIEGTADTHSRHERLWVKCFGFPSFNENAKTVPQQSWQEEEKKKGRIASNICKAQGTGEERNSRLDI